jgi:hypothetical protein
MDRRTFCIGSAAAAVCCHTDGVFAAACTGAAAIGLDQVLFDSRYAECRSFAAAAHRSGNEIVAFQGDVTRLWQHMLHPRWAAGGGAIAGMTTPSSLFCLEQLAKDHWKRLVIRIDHRRSVAGVPSHRVTASEPMLSRTFAALNHRQEWPERVMNLVNTCERAGGRPRSTCLVSGADTHPCASTRADLVSWVIA